jgi:hypothetical protein
VLQDSSVHQRVEEPVTPGSTNAKAVFVRRIMKALTDVWRTVVTPWSGKLPRPRVSPVMTLGDCATEAQRGRQRIHVGTLTKALEQVTSSTLAMRKIAAATGDRGNEFQFQKHYDLRDPTFPHTNQTPFRSVTIVGIGGPRHEYQHGPCESFG